MKSITYYLVLSLLGVSISQSIFCQDPHFSQYFNSPLTLNPALSGKINGQYRLAGIYRNQWPAINNAFVTSGFAMDGTLSTSKENENNRLGVGISALTDKTSNAVLKSNYFSLSVAYHLELDPEGHNNFSIGFQGGYSNRRLDASALKFESQLDLSGRWTRPSNEILFNSMVNINYYDINTGVLFSGTNNNDNSYYLGVSVYHLNKPTVGFLTASKFELSRRYTLHSGGSLSIDNSSTLYFTALYNQQTNVKEVVAGIAVELPVEVEAQNSTGFLVGCWTRINNQYDAIIPYLGLDFNSMKLGLTYDINTSVLSTGTQKRGGMELTLMYTHQKNKDEKNIPCPRF